MIETLQHILVTTSDFLWSYIIITILICCALFFTVRTRFVQFRLIREMIHLLVYPDKIHSQDGSPDDLSAEIKLDGEMKHISSFQAFVVALASRIGTGNLAGVATAISIGADQEPYSGCGHWHYLVLPQLSLNLHWHSYTSAKVRPLSMVVPPTI